MNSISDNYLMTKVKEGSIDLAGLLFERYKRILLAFFYNQVKDKSTCEDLVQVTFYKVIKYRNSFDPSKNFKAWVFTIARNLLKDELRMSYKIKKRSLEGLENLIMATTGCMVSMNFERKRIKPNNHGSIKRTIGRTEWIRSPMSQKMFVLRYYSK